MVNIPLFIGFQLSEVQHFAAIHSRIMRIQVDSTSTPVGFPGELPIMSQAYESIFNRFEAYLIYFINKRSILVGFELPEVFAVSRYPLVN